MNHPDLAKDLTGKSAEMLKFIGMKPIANNVELFCLYVEVMPQFLDHLQSPNNK